MTINTGGSNLLSIGVYANNQRTAKNKSVENITHLIIEEADELSYEDFIQLQMTVRSKDSKIIMLFNPPLKDH